MALCLFVASLGGWTNLTFLMSELRAPPQSLGSVNAIAYTLSNIAGGIAPFICTLDDVKPLMISFAFAIFTTITTHCLPKPGAYLPKVTDELDQSDVFASLKS